MTSRWGVVAWSDARHLGRDRWAYLHRRGDLIRVYPGVSVVAGVETTPQQVIEAAVASCQRSALASHRTAVWMYGIDVGDAPIDVTVPRSSRLRDRPGVVIHRPRDRGDLGATIRQGIRCTNPLRTLLDLGAVAGDLVEPTLDRFVLDRRLTFNAVTNTVDRHAEHGRDGLGALRRAVGRWPFGDVLPDSPLELLMGRLMISAGLRRFVAHPVIAGYEVDFAFPDRRVIVETDGWEFHGSRDAFELDRHRDAVLAGAGWLVVRFTWRQIEDGPTVIERVRRVLATRPERANAPQMSH